jgi:AcrR family transcriptional regulator
MATFHAAPSLKEKQRREREALILQAAEEVLLEKGYYETSMDEIATRVGVSKGTIYLHFPGKEELVVAIIQRDMQAFLQGVDSAIASMPTARAKLEALLHYIYSGLFCKHTQLLSSIYNGIDMRRLITEKGGCLRELWESLAVHVSTILEEGKAAGEFDPSITTPVMVRTFFTFFASRSYDPLLMGDSLSPEDLTKQMAKIYFDGVIIKKANEII